MSDPSADGTAPVLPPAAFEITRYRRAMEDAAVPTRAVRAGIAGFVIASLALVATLVFMAQDVSVRAGGVTALVAIGVAGTGVVLALFVILPFQLANRERRRRMSEVAATLDDTAEGLRAHLESIGYAVPREVALDWLASPDSTSTVPLVHDSVIAARWWQPAPDDERVFVEPFLRQGAHESSLPVLGTG